MLSVLHFKVKNTKICIDLKYIHKIIPIVQLEAVPNGPVALIGLLNLYGESISVYDLATLLSLPNPANITLDTPVIICTLEKQKIGIVVDEIMGLESIDETALQSPDIVHANKSEFSAVATIDSGLTLVLNQNKIFIPEMESADHG